MVLCAWRPAFSPFLRRKPGWWGILIIIPVVNLIVPGYLAWSD